MALKFYPQKWAKRNMGIVMIMDTVIIMTTTMTIIMGTTITIMSTIMTIIMDTTTTIMTMIMTTIIKPYWMWNVISFNKMKSWQPEIEVTLMQKAYLPSIW
ncbi:hypothetical protein [Allomuricauda sp. M10]|uniref:hypothetical protein n=1 Tax=Allomuricauda sp. M10 TaxID=2683292 RepID=UPI001D195E29|nr:hypothetical protein [Muricauda sp. M10]